MKTALLLTLALLAISFRASAQSSDFGPALSLDGVDDYVSVPGFGSSIPTSEITVEFWAYAESAATTRVAFILSPDQGSNRFLAQVSPQNPLSWDFGNTAAGGRLNAADNGGGGKWVHYALVSSTSGAGFMKIYVNGVEHASKVGGGTFTQGSYELRIGGIGGYHFQGKLDDFRVWNKARTQAQIQANYTRTLVGTESGLVLYYKFDEASGDAINSVTSQPLPGTFTNGATRARTTDVVENTNDSGPGSLRQALLDAAATPGAQNLSLAPALSGQTIVLRSEIGITDTDGVTIDATVLHEGLTIDGGAGNNRIFYVNSGKKLGLNGLTLTGGNAPGDAGGAICNIFGTLALTQCTLFGNSASYGGAIYSYTSSNFTSSSTTISHCTLTSNTASDGGGGIFNYNGRTTLIGCTITRNTAPAGNGSGVVNSGYTIPQTVVQNSIIAGNAQSDVDFISGSSNSFISSGHNLIGTGNGIGDFDESGDNSGIIDPKLAPLGNYGGHTPTTIPFPDSPAIDGGVAIVGVTTDQRGFLRTVGGAPDIGAVEISGFIVSNTANAGAGSLRQALADAAANSDFNDVFFDANLNGGTISLASEITISDPGGVSVVAANLLGGITIDDGSGTSYRLLNIAAGSTVSLQGINFANGGGLGFGGGGGTILNQGSLTMTQCTISVGTANSGFGGGIFNTGSNSKLSLTNCTLTGNSALNGGAIFNDSVCVVTHCTITGNTATDAGSIYGGGGIYNNGGQPGLVAQLILSNTIVSRNIAIVGADISSRGGSVTYAGKNLVQTVAQPVTPATITGLAPINLAPNLALLGNYGGPTKTMPPLSGSPAIDPFGGDTTSALAFDQRGQPRLAGSRVDIGAVESQSTAEQSYGTVAFALAAQDVFEEAGTAKIVINRTGGALGSASVLFATTPGTATAADYTSENRTITFAHGETSKTVPVTLTSDLALNEPNETFTATVSNLIGLATLGSPGTTTIRIVDAYDLAAPTLTLLTPAVNAIVLEAVGSVNITGKASDNQGIARVQLSFNGSAFTDIPIILSTDGKSTDYTITKTPVPGLNTFSVRTVDTRGRLSAVITRSFTFQVDRTLTVAIAGPANSGTVITGFMPNSIRKAGFVYTITATPKPGFVFNGWTTTGSTTGTGITTISQEAAKLTFTMTTTLTGITANFSTNPFIPTAGPGVIPPTGTYNGLVTQWFGYPANNETMGMVQNVVVSSTGAFTGSLLIDGLKLPLVGVFNNVGAARFGPTRSDTLILMRNGKPSFNVQLTLDMTNTTNKLTGWVEQTYHGSIVATSTIDADRAAYSAASAVTKVPANLAGTTSKPYTLIFAARTGQDSGLNSAYWPQGDGFATASVNVNGIVSLSGKLADHTAITASAPLSKLNEWPVFAQLYSLKGCIHGMAKLDDTQPTTDMTATNIQWFRPVQATSQWYPDGWAAGISVTIAGSKYAVPPATPAQSVFPNLNGSFDNATLNFYDGNLAADLTQDISIAPSNVVTNVITPVPSVINPTMVINRTAGLITGAFTHSDGTRPTYQGVILQKNGSDGAYGYFMTVSPKVVDGTGKGGAVTVFAK
ncbi:MAG: hypothetical protein JNM99_20685 [Verrucomicrobiaceae bacterium]|nr:hypothetical protein [Verrucomicrobiaceae bacterium]